MLRKLFWGLCSVIILFLGLGTGYYFYVRNIVQNFDVNQKLQCVVHKIFDRNNEQIGVSALKNLQYIPIEEIPELLINTTIAIEDNSFYSNNGLSISGMLRAILYFVPSQLGYRKLIGGSTITQQIARQLFLTQDISLTRKLKELFYAVAMNRTYTKQQILEIYFNHSYFGYGIYGIKAITQCLFNKSPEEMLPVEIATLVALLNTPINYHSSQDYLERKIHHILSVMKEKNLINNEQYMEAQKTPISLRNSSHRSIIHVVRKYLHQTYGEENCNRKNYDVYVTIDQSLQSMGQKCLTDGVIDFEESHQWKGPIAHWKEFNRESLTKISEKLGLHYMAVYITDSNGSYRGLNGIKGVLNDKSKEKYQAHSKITPGHVVLLSRNKRILVNMPQFNGHLTILNARGEILASIGTIDSALADFQINTESLRHPASCIKIFDYLIAMEEGLDPQTLVNDQAGYVINDKFIAGVCPSSDLWDVHNWDKQFLGPITLEQSLMQSRNTPFVQIMLNRVGLKKMKQYFIKFGLLAKQDAIFPAHITGSLNIRPIDFAARALLFINGGYFGQANLIRKVKNNGYDVTNDDNIISLQKIAEKRNIRHTLNAMKESVHNGLCRKLKPLGIHHIYAKTGTSHKDNRDANCIVIVNTVAHGPIVVFCGLCSNDDASLGRNTYGSVFPVLIIRNLLEKMQLKDQDPIS